jgi:hypothetical protein
MPSQPGVYNPYWTYSPGLAWRAICFSNWAYKRTDALNQKFSQVLGLYSVVNLLPADALTPNTVLVTSPNGIEIAFEGTTTIPQWLGYIAGARTTQQAGTGITTFKPFADWSEMIWAGLWPRLDATIPISLYGHSLGGAMACLIGARLIQSNYNVRVIYTCGCPRVFDSDSADSFASPAHHVIMSRDLVPLQPFPTTRLNFVGTSPPGFIRPLYRPGFGYQLSGELTTLAITQRQLEQLDDPRSVLNLASDLANNHFMRTYLVNMWRALSPSEKFFQRRWLSLVQDDFGVQIDLPLAA